jgi:hypothetical protein
MSSSCLSHTHFGRSIWRPFSLIAWPISTTRIPVKAKQHPGTQQCSGQADTVKAKSIPVQPGLKGGQFQKFSKDGGEKLQCRFGPIQQISHELSPHSRLPSHDVWLI